MKKVKRYPCKQQELYQAARIGWSSFLSELPKFTAYKARYTAAYRTARLAEIDAAQAIPDDRVRAGQITTLLLAVEETSKACLNRWQDLKSYIGTAFGGDLEESKLIEAGADYYLDASRRDWEAVSQLMNDGLVFINANSVKLKAGDNMPNGFQLFFAGAKNNFAAALDAYMLGDENGKLQTEQKIDASNIVYDALQEMFADGQKIFRSEPAKHDWFVFERVLEIITHHVADVKGVVSTGVAHLPVEGAVISIAELDESVIADAEGRYDFGVIPAGTYTLTIVKDGFQPITVNNLEVPTGTTLTRNFELIAA